MSRVTISQAATSPLMKDILAISETMRRDQAEFEGRAFLRGRTVQEGGFLEAVAEGATIYVGKKVWDQLTGGKTDAIEARVEGRLIRLCRHLADDAMIAMKEPDLSHLWTEQWTR